MDESVELFKARQRQSNAAQPIGRYLGIQIAVRAISILIMVVTLIPLLLLLELFPRNLDNSVKFQVYGPVLGLVAAGSALVLKFGKTVWKPIRSTCWFYIALASITIAIGFVDLLSKTGN